LSFGICGKLCNFVKLFYIYRHFAALRRELLGKQRRVIINSQFTTSYVKVWDRSADVVVNSPRVVSQLDVCKGMLSGVSSTAHNNAGRCFLFERGQCRRGSACRYLHVVETSSSHRQDESVGEQGPQLTEGQNTTTSPKPCRFFLRTGWCGYGSNCRFTHCKLSAAKNCSRGEDGGTDAQLEDTSSLVCSAQDDGQQKPQKESERRKPCWFFKHGRCHFGEKCRQVHITAEGTGVSDEQDATKLSRKFGRGTETGWHRRTVQHNQQKQRAQTDKDAQNVTAQTEKDAQNATAQCDRDVQNATAQSDKEAQNVTAQSDIDAQNATAQTDKEAQSVTAQTDKDAQNTTADVKQVPNETKDMTDKLETLRATEIKQLCRRYPKALMRDSEDGSTAVTFVFEPTDPDWVRKLQH